MDPALTFPNPMDILAICVLICSINFYLLLYTTYDKVSKSYSLNNLVDVFTFAKGYDTTLVELNKAISLAGLTLLLVSFVPAYCWTSENLSMPAALPYTSASSSDMFAASWYLLIIHSIYSSYKYYSFSIFKLIEEKFWVKQVSIILGSIAQTFLTCLVFGIDLPFFFPEDYQVVPSSKMKILLIILTLAHFWSYEVDFKFRLGIRPYGMAPFYIAPFVFLAVIFPLF
jgi:hypothetical protein